MTSIAAYASSASPARPSRRLTATLLAAGASALLFASTAAAQFGPPPGVTDAQPGNSPTVVTGGTATWGLSTYLNSANFGRPNPLPSGYVAPATFDAETRLSTWGDASGHLWSDGSASLAFAGTTVNFTSTGGGWLRLQDLQVELDKDGNGTVSAEVSYGTAVGTPPSIPYDPEQEAAQGPIRIVIVTLTGNATPASVDDGVATWSGLEGQWTAAFSDVLSWGPWTYASTIDNDAEGRNPLPFTFTVDVSAE